MTIIYQVTGRVGNGTLVDVKHVFLCMCVGECTLAEHVYAVYNNVLLTLAEHVYDVYNNVLLITLNQS